MLSILVNCVVIGVLRLGSLATRGAYDRQDDTDHRQAFSITLNCSVSIGQLECGQFISQSADQDATIIGQRVAEVER